MDEGKSVNPFTMDLVSPGLAELRKPFPPETVGKLPRVTKKDGDKSKCKDCGGYLPPHIHLDYVGHATVTDRLLTVDPMWSWEPLALDGDGLPALRRTNTETTLWIKLTICGVTRLGVGSVPSGAFEAEKQLIGDALRNAAMRFGVALDLWSKEELESEVAGGGAPSGNPGDRGAAGSTPPPRTSDSTPPPPNVPAEGQRSRSGEVPAVPKEGASRPPGGEGGPAPMTGQAERETSQGTPPPASGFTCPICDETQGNAATLLLHTRRVHPENVEAK